MNSVLQERDFFLAKEGLGMRIKLLWRVALLLKVLLSNFLLMDRYAHLMLRICKVD